VIKRPFDKDLYNKYDNKSREALVKLLEERGHRILSVSENYYADITSEYKGRVFYSEGEVKTAWTGDWPEHWAEIRIPERKSRLIKKYDGCVDFYIFDNNLEKCWKIQGRHLTDGMLKNAYGRNIRSGEKFYHVPYNEAELVYVPSRSSTG
jgi:hypothetical protein